MADMKISNTLINDTSDKTIAYAEQLKQQIINWAEYNHVTEKLGPNNRPNTQNLLNNLFLRVYEEFLTFLNNADATDQAINTWKEIEAFLAGYTDDKTLVSIVAQLNANIESRLNVPLANETGDSITTTMTQKAITEAIDNVAFSSGEKVKEVGIDNNPTVDSDNLVRSGGVQNELALGAVYDVSAKNPTAGPNNDGKFESLSALLSDANLNTLIPTAVRKGGMSIKFVQSSDNMYVQYRLMSDSFNTTVANWQGVDKEPTEGSNGLVESGGVNKRINSGFFVGKGNTLAYTNIYNLSPSTTYRLCNKSKGFDTTGITGGVLYVSAYKDNVRTELTTITNSNTDFLYFTTPASIDFDYIRVDGRAVSGVKVNFFVEIWDKEIIPLTYNTDRRTTRIQVNQNIRRTGLYISYIEDEKLIIERYIGNSFTDGNWRDSSNWTGLDINTVFDSINSNSLYDLGLSISFNYIEKSVTSVYINNISKYYAGDNNYYIWCIIQYNGSAQNCIVQVTEGDNTVSCVYRGVELANFNININSLVSNITIRKYLKATYIELVKSYYFTIQSKDIISGSGNVTLLKLVTENGYVNDSGTIVTSSDYRHSQQISLKAGEVICVKATTVPSIAVIAKYDSNSYMQLVGASSVTGEHTYSYKAEEDITVVLSGRYLKNAVVYSEYVFTDNNTFLPIKEKVDSVKSVAAGEDMVPENVKNQSNFTTNFEVGKYLQVGSNIFYEEIATYSSASLAKLNKNSLIKLYGGGKYKVRHTFLTNAVGDGLYDNNLTFIQGYSVNGGNAEKVSASSTEFLQYTVDLTDYVGEYYLRVSMRNTAGYLNTLIVNAIQVNVVNEETLGIHQTYIEHWTDNFKKDKNSRLELQSGTYGQDGAVYKVSLQNRINRIAVDFKINTNVNEDKDNIQVVQLVESNISAGIICAAPTLLKESYTTDNQSYVQEIGYQSGITFGEGSSSNKIRNTQNYKPLVGDVALMVWLKGDISTTEPSASTLNARAQWLEQNQDYILKVENDTLSIERNGIANDDTEWNDGQTSVVFSTSLKTGNDYKTVGALYTELSALDYLYVEILNSDPRKTCEDLFQFGTVRMVGKYNQQIDRTSDTLAYKFDSYPIALRYAIDESIHTLEIITNGSSINYISIDGIYAQTTKISKTFIIGSQYIELLNIEVWDGLVGDDVAFNKSGTLFATNHTPLLYGLMGHETVDTYEGSGEIINEVHQSSSRLESVCSYLKQHNYNVLSLDKISNVADIKGLRIYGNKIAFFCYDDLSFMTLYANKKNFAHVSRYGYPMNFAVIHSSLRESSEAQELILPMRVNNWCCATHSLKHDVAIPRKNSVSLYWELQKILKDCDEFNLVNNILVYNWSGSWSNTYNMLNMCGYVAAIDSSGTYSTLATNPYNLHRVNISDGGSTLDTLESRMLV